MPLSPSCRLIARLLAAPVAQRTALAVDMLPALAEEARKRQLAGLLHGAESPVRAALPQRETDDAGKAVEVAARSIERPLAHQR